MVMLVFGQAFPATYVEYPFPQDFIQELANHRIAFRLYNGAVVFYLVYSSETIEGIYPLPLKEITELTEEFTRTFGSLLSSLFPHLPLSLSPEWILLRW